MVNYKWNNSCKFHDPWLFESIFIYTSADLFGEFAKEQEAGLPLDKAGLGLKVKVHALQVNDLWLNGH